LKSRGVLFIGLLVSIIYVYSIVTIQISSSSKVSPSGSLKFLFIKKPDESKFISQLSNKDKNSTLITTIKEYCSKTTCKQSITFSDIKDNKNFCELMRKLIFFTKDNNLSKASIIADGESVEINFLLNNKDELETLKKLYEDYEKDFKIEDHSSVVEYFNIKQMQEFANEILKKTSFELNSDAVSFKTRKSLNKIFRKLKALGSLDIELGMDLDDKEMDILKKFIKKNYPWVKE